MYMIFYSARKFQINNYLEMYNLGATVLPKGINDYILALKAKDSSIEVNVDLIVSNSKT